jgi:protein-disulfide isomerase
MAGIWYVTPFLKNIMLNGSKFMIKNILGVISGVVLLSLIHVQIGCDMPGDQFKQMQEDIKALKAGQTAVLKELGEIKSLLSKGGAPSGPDLKDVVLTIEDSPSKGNKDAKLVLVEFSDYQCPFCGRHVRDTNPQLEADYIKTGKVKHIFKDFPLDFHKNAFKAAEAANCAGDEGKYWEMHDILFKNQTALTNEDLLSYAKEIGITDTNKFKQCLDSEKYAEEVKEDIKVGQQAGVTGTPTFFLGFTEKDGTKVKVVSKIVGARPYPGFKEEIDKAISSQN